MDVHTIKLSGQLYDGTCLLAMDCLIIEMGSGRQFEEDDSGDAPASTSVSLGSAVPNPFNPVTRISYYVPREMSVKLNVYDVKGRLVDTLVSGVSSVGEHTVQWQANGLASGIYFYRLEVGNFVQTKKMILLK